LRVLTFEAFGVPLEVSVEDPRLLAAVEEILPPGWRELRVDAGAPSRFVLEGFDETRCDLRGGDVDARGLSIEAAVRMLDARIRAAIALRAPGLVFVHAGVAGIGEAAIVIPGRSRSGKTTLIQALLAAGASYFSDEYAVVDLDGLVHAYPRPLAIRHGSGWRTVMTPAAELGASVARGPLPIGLVVITEFEPGSVWEPRVLSVGAGALELLHNAVAARSEPARVLRALSASVGKAIVLEGRRGEARGVAHALLRALEEAS
jgi:hypothetical protein